MKHSVKYIASLLAMLYMGAMECDAKVTLPRILSPGMVVQREHPVVLWGKADPGETVTVKITDSRNKTVGPRKGISVTAGDDGQWRAEYSELKAGGPYTITINDITIDNVLSGDVYLFSGQSNIDLTVGRVTDMFADEIASYSNDKIRHFNVPNAYEFHQPLDDVKNCTWQPTTDEQLMAFSALAYFFSKELNGRTGLPVGIIRSSWGGTPIESWIKEERLAEFPGLVNKKRIYEDDAYRNRINQLAGESSARRQSLLYATDPGLHDAVKWYEPAFDDSDWPTVEIPSGSVTDGTIAGDDIHCGWKPADGWATDGLNPVNGSHWFRKTVSLPSSMAGKPGLLRLGCIVDADSVYVNGTFVGTVSYQYPPRKYPIPAGLLKEGDNQITIRLFSNGGRANFVPEKPYKLIAGDEEINLEGAWKYHRGAVVPPVQGGVSFNYIPAVLYNAMIHPIINYPVNGVVWYQGESNVDTRNSYTYMLKTLMDSWRADFNDSDMPFYIVELADFLHKNDRGGRAAWAEMRRNQAEAAKSTHNAYLVPNSDLGEWNDIHPLDKKTVGHRVVEAVIKHNEIKK